MKEHYQLMPVIAKETWDQLVLLAISGAGGAYVRAVFVPEERWARRVVQGVAGALSAIFLGGAIAQIVSNFVDVPFYAYLASGFIMGSAGEFGVKFVQEKIMGRQAK